VARLLCNIRPHALSPPAAFTPPNPRRTPLWRLVIANMVACLFIDPNPTHLTPPPQDAKLAARYRATLAGFAIYTGATLLLIVLGDALYRLKRVEGADGFVSFKR